MDHAKLEPDGLDYVQSAAIALAAVWLAFTSGVGVWFLPRTATETLSIGYALTLAWLLREFSDERRHWLAMAVGILFWSARGMGFAELWFTQGRTDLGGATLERLMTVTLIATWHIRRASVAAHRKHSVPADG